MEASALHLFFPAWRPFVHRYLFGTAPSSVGLSHWPALTRKPESGQEAEEAKAGRAASGEVVCMVE